MVKKEDLIHHEREMSAGPMPHEIREKGVLILHAKVVKEDLILHAKVAKEDLTLHAKVEREDLILHVKVVKEDLTPHAKVVREDLILQEKAGREDLILHEKGEDPVLDKGPRVHAPHFKGQVLVRVQTFLLR